jgi:integrase
MPGRARLASASQSLPPVAYAWHRKPRGTYGNNCPICGAAYAGLHRARRGEEGFEVRRRDGEIVTCNRKRARNPARRVGATPRTRDLIAKAADLIARGLSRAAAAARIGTSPEAIWDFQRRHAAIWNEALEQSMVILRDEIRSISGTRRVFEDPAALARAARAVESWCRDRGGALIDWREGALTLRSFFEAHHLPICLAGAAQAYVEMFRSCLRLWAVVVGDPPLDHITREHLALFRDFLSACDNQDGSGRASPTTVRNKLRQIRTLLERAGPPGYRNPDAFGFIEKVPRLRLPAALERDPEVVSVEVLDAIYVAAEQMERPRLSFASPAEFWRAFLVLIFNTGVRRGTLLKLRVGDVDVEAARLAVSADRMKARRAHAMPLNETALRHLGPLLGRDAGEILFPGGCVETICNWFGKLQALAGIAEADRFGLHALRRTNATILWEAEPAAAALMLGHANGRTTAKHYVNKKGILARAVERMPQPRSFAEGHAPCVADGPGHVPQDPGASAIKRFVVTAGPLAGTTFEGVELRPPHQGESLQ